MVSAPLMEGVKPVAMTMEVLEAKSGDTNDPHGCQYINKYCSDKHRESLSCIWTHDKGRILLANRSFEEGEVLFEEPPLHIVHEPAETMGTNEFFEKVRLIGEQSSLDYETLWYWCAFNSLTEEDLANRIPHGNVNPHGKQAEESLLPSGVVSKSVGDNMKLLNTITADQQKKLLLLYHGEINSPSADMERLIEELGLASKDDKPFAILCERLLQVWILNCFEHSEIPLGYSTYFMSSFMSHSCLPNVVWHYREDSVFVLRARRRVRQGDEICCSYLAEEALLESAMSRRDCLQESKHFVCTCERCSGAPNKDSMNKLPDPELANFDLSKDLSRGFSCMWCKTGVVYPNSLQSQDPDLPFGCESCDKFQFPQDFAKLSVAESELEKTAKAWESAIEKANKTYGSSQGTMKALTEAKIALVLEKASFVLASGKHWVLDKLWAIAQEYYDELKDYERAIHYCKLRVNFQKSCYPGTNGALAWTQENLGELLFRAARKEGKELRWYEESIAEFDSAAAILGIMFGEEHDYYATVDQKRRRVQKKLAQKKGEIAPTESGTATSDTVTYSGGDYESEKGLNLVDLAKLPTNITTTTTD